MGAWLSRVTTLKNETGMVIRIRECPAGDPDGEQAVVPIELKPGEQKDISATRFHVNAVLSRRPTCVKVFIIQDKEQGRKLIHNREQDKEVLIGIFAPHDFMNYSKFVFKMDPDHRQQPIVRRYRPEGSSLHRLKIVRLLTQIDGLAT